MYFIIAFYLQLRSQRLIQLCLENGSKINRNTCRKCVHFCISLSLLFHCILNSVLHLLVDSMTAVAHVKSSWKTNSKQTAFTVSFFPPPSSTLVCLLAWQVISDAEHTHTHKQANGFMAISYTFFSFVRYKNAHQQSVGQCSINICWFCDVVYR